MRYRAAAVALAGLVLAGCASGQGTGSGSPASGSVAPGSGSTSGPSAGGTATAPGSAGVGSGGTPSQVAAIAATCPTNQNFAVQNGPSSRPVPADLKVSWVLRCTISHKGGTSVLVAERSAGDLSALLRALRTPSAQRQKVVCPMMAVYLPYFALVQPDGQLFVPKVPVNNCNQPQNMVVQALESLRFSELSTRTLK